MTLWIFLVCALATRAAGIGWSPILTPNGSEKMDESYLESDDAKDLKPGCVTYKEGRANWKIRFIYCLASSGNRFTVTFENVDTSPKYAKIEFNKNNTGFICDELSISRPSFEEFLIPDARGNVHLKVLFFINLKLPTYSLACVLNTFSAKDTRTLIFQNPIGELQNIHIRGLNFTEIEIINDKDSNTRISVFDVLSPAVNSVKIHYGKMDLTPGNQVYPELAQLFLFRGNISSLAKGTFKNAPNVLKLHLADNYIKHIDVYAFEGLRKLRDLNLERNLITTLPDGVFQYSPGMRQINLNENYLTEITPGVFAGLNRLESISINENKVELKLHNLTFSGKRTLTSIDLQSSHITSLPADVFLNTINLKTLDLTNNEIDVMPRILFNNLKLNTLMLGRNRIKNVPVGLFTELTELENLDLGYNQIEKFDDLMRVFYDLKKLLTLDLTRNRIHFLHHALFDFSPKLKRLELKDMGTSISMTNNVYPPTDIYRSSQKDEDYGSSENLYSPFQNLLNLEELHLSGNNISVMCTDWRTSYTLNVLDLSYNSFTYLTSEDMHFRSQHITINLRNNKLTHFDPFVYEYAGYVPTPRYFLMANNPYECNCSHLPLIKKLQQNNFTNLQNLTFLYLPDAECAGPSNLKGWKFNDFLILAKWDDCKSSSNISTVNAEHNISTIQPTVSASSTTSRISSTTLATTLPVDSVTYSEKKSNATKFRNLRLSVPSSSFATPAPSTLKRSTLVPRMLTPSVSSPHVSTSTVSKEKTVIPTTPTNSPNSSLETLESHKYIQNIYNINYDVTIIHINHSNCLFKEHLTYYFMISVSLLHRFVF